MSLHSELHVLHLKRKLNEYMPHGDGAKLTEQQLLDIHFQLWHEHFADWALGVLTYFPVSGVKEKPPTSKEVLARLEKIVRKVVPDVELSPTYIRKLRHALTKTGLWEFAKTWRDWLKALPRKFTLPPGEYRLGDPCYIIPEDQGSDYLDNTLYSDMLFPGVMTKEDRMIARIGVELVPVPGTEDEIDGPNYTQKSAVFNTAFGDGWYYAAIKNANPPRTGYMYNICVDSGLIGFISTDRDLQEDVSDNGTTIRCDTPLEITYSYQKLEFTYGYEGKTYRGTIHL